MKKTKTILLVKIGRNKQGESEPSSSITEIKRLTATELAEITKDKSFLADYFGTLKLGQSVRMNCHDFLEAVANYGASFCQDRAISPEKMDEIGLNYSRLLLNILSIFRSFLDHSGKSISRFYGKKSQERDRWKAHLSEIYDSVFAYRFLYKLRNYAQHVGVPPLKFSFTASVEMEGVQLTLDFDRNKLLEERHVWKSALADELQRMKESFPVINILDEWLEAFDNVCNCVLDIKRERTLRAAKRILHYRELHKVEEYCKIGIAEFPAKVEPEKGLKLRMIDFPEVDAYMVVKQDGAA